MNLTEIISEADVRVSNSFSVAQKVTWLNEINNEFFDVVKIPATATITTVAATKDYPLTAAVRTKNIDSVRIGTTNYRSFVNENVPAGQNYWLYDETTNQITLNPAPTSIMTGLVRYSRIATTTFLSTALTVSPDAPSEYHWIYILGLCERIAKAMDDVGKANNYANDYRGNLQIAQANYQR